MGIIAVSTPLSAENSLPERNPIKRQKTVKSNALVINKGVPIETYINPMQPALSKLKMKRIVEINTSSIFESNYLDLICNTSWFFQTESNTRPNWSGYMQNVSEGPYPGSSHITYLPIIDLNPNDETCIFSILLFLKKNSQNFSI